MTPTAPIAGAGPEGEPTPPATRVLNGSAGGDDRRRDGDAEVL